MQILKTQKKFGKKFFISEIFAFELLARDSPSFDENIFHWQSYLTKSPNISDLTKRDFSEKYLSQNVKSKKIKMVSRSFPQCLGPVTTVTANGALNRDFLDI